MSEFVQLHLLTSYPPSNLNRDDLGRPKTAIMGGVNRLRISSQSLKRAWRTSEVFEEALGDWKGIRTKQFGNEIKKMLLEQSVQEKNAQKWASEIAACFGKLKKVKKGEPESLEIEQLAHISPEEKMRVEALVKILAEENREPDKNELKLLRKTPKAVDIALFGRMLASDPAYNVEAAAQVAHAITVHPVKVDDDYFTAVDDLNTFEEDAGAAHIGEATFGAGVFYLYICINRDLLLENLQGDKSLARKTLEALVETAARVSPAGKQNSFASRAYTSYMLAEKGSQQPRSLSVAFLKPIISHDQLSDAIKVLEKQKDNFDKIYGSCSESSEKFNVLTGQGTLNEIKEFVISDLEDKDTEA
ncbi:MAG TPA: type I-E CRISPR-associated protein Cas7/Cse4/CasC [Deltaproteobacteria bacterium]|nr:MAG: type I-E CRISPR-associated protein Cas7/Cse4/CasC [Deltaproteobacteria bacterium]HDG96801.1 type I-E CRISPR-associated protein Cas7/Cse4/CasC [Desulfobacterales bacterium]HDH98342.1 type I-E CRISPR-associated protein Cas7/Cse4/CasC [Deltaproteobacteria bacterium]